MFQVFAGMLAVLCLGDLIRKIYNYSEGTDLYMADLLVPAARFLAMVG